MTPSLPAFFGFGCACGCSGDSDCCGGGEEDGAVTFFSFFFPPITPIPPRRGLFFCVVLSSFGWCLEGDFGSGGWDAGGSLALCCSLSEPESVSWSS